MWLLKENIKEMSGCGLAGIINVKGELIPGDLIIKFICCQYERGNGLGAGFAAYGIYPEHKDYYALHVMAQDKTALEKVEEILAHKTFVNYKESIPTKKVKTIKNAPLFKRYFVKPKFDEEYQMVCGEDEEDNYIVSLVMDINEKVEGAYVISSGKNMGVFKGVGFPDEIAEFFKIDEYKAFIWTAHHRFPANTPGWWGGAHPFTILDWSIIHNGEISSYGTNKRYLELFGYKCTLLTDTEVIAYLLDLLIRRHGLPLQLACKALAPPFWMEIDEMEEEERELYTAMRVVYGSALLNGPFAILFAYNGGLVGLYDRAKLRPLVCAKKGDFYYMASEEAAIRTICPDPEKVWAPKAGEPVIVELEKGVIPNQRSYLEGRPKEVEEDALRIKCQYVPSQSS
jgi:glutamate synthase domain-containing protein 1